MIEPEISWKFLLCTFIQLQKRHKIQSKNQNRLNPEMGVLAKSHIHDTRKSKKNKKNPEPGVRLYICVKMQDINQN